MVDTESDDFDGAMEFLLVVDDVVGDLMEFSVVGDVVSEIIIDD